MAKKIYHFNMVSLYYGIALLYYCFIRISIIPFKTFVKFKDFLANRFKDCIMMDKKYNLH